MKVKKTLIFSNIFFFLFCLIFSITFLYFVASISQYGVEKINFDFRAFYTGGQMVRHHVSEGFYKTATQYAWEKKYFNVAEEKYLMAFVYPSFVALPFALLAAFSVKVAYQIEAVCNLLLALTTLYILLKTLKVFSSLAITIVFCIAFFCFLPLWDGLSQGQFGCILFFSFVLSWALLKKQKHILAGFVLSLLLVRPHLFIVPFVIFLWKKNWKVLTGMTLGGLILLLISTMITGIDFFLQYLTLLYSYQTVAGLYVHPLKEPTIRGFFQAMYNTPDFRKVVIPYMIFSLLSFAMLLYGWKGKIVMKKSFDLQWGMLIIVTILTSLHTNPHDLLLLFFPAIILGNIIFTHMYHHKKPAWQIALASFIFISFILVGCMYCYTPLIIIAPICFFIILCSMQLYLHKQI